MTQSVKQYLNELLEAGKLDQNKYQDYLTSSGENIDKLMELLGNDKNITEDDVMLAKAKILNLGYINLEGKEIPPGTLKILPRDLAENYQMVVIEKKNTEITVGMVDPLNFKAVEAIEFLARKRDLKVKYVLISSTGFKHIFRSYESMKEQVGQALDFAEEKFAPKKETSSLEKATNLEEVIKTAPVSKIVSVLLRHAIEGGASDIHIEPQGDKSRIRYRIDGILHTSIVLPIYVHAALVSRIKVISNLKIDETRIPQDGRIRLNINSKDIDFRVSTIPLIGLEKVVMRILKSPEKAPSFKELGFLGSQEVLMQKNLKKPNGMYLVTGPTGSGKSTTLFSALSSLNDTKVNIATLEDPVEYHVEGVNQSQVRAEVGFTFASGLRALLRQDPDIIMVGEIRDSETAELAIHAALTGHFVLSTLHTNDAVGAIPRLIDMGSQPFLLASTLNLILAQRLVRKICPNCKVQDELPADIREEIKMNLGKLDPGAYHKGVAENKDYKVYKGKGCVKCGDTGYKGRLAIAEVFHVTEEMREVISKGFHMEEVKPLLKKQNFVNLVQDGWMKVLLGMTTVEEILRVTKVEE